jgi:uncharacterized protein YecE (DUF72 family)
MKKLKDPEDPLERFFSNAQELGRRAGPVLYQLPPRWPLNLDRFETFLDALVQQNRALREAGFKGRLRHAVEFREPSWYDERIYSLLDRHRAALCLHDMQGSASPRVAIGPFVYVRFHGRTKYAGRYEDGLLDTWAAWLSERASEGLDVFAYFNNDSGGHAPHDAARLRERIHAII